MDYKLFGIEPSAKNVWLSNPERLNKTKKAPQRKTIEKMKTNAFNPDTRKMFSPLMDSSPVKAKVNQHNKECEKSYRSFMSKSSYGKPWGSKRAISASRKSSIRSFANQIKRQNKFNQSIDLGTTKSSNFNSSFTSGFHSTQRSTALGSTKTDSSKGTFYSSIGLNKSFTRVNGYKRVNKKIPSYDFTGGDSPWINKAGIYNKIQGKEQNFKINIKNYEKEFDSARPTAHTKARKYSDMTRFFKNLEDNRIFRKWKMSAYRGNFR